MREGHTRMLLSGNHALAYGVKFARPQVMPVYPITPQTPILEKLSEFQAKGELCSDLMTVESEHSAMAACIAASLAGARVFTATSSQGLLLMHEMLHYATGAQAPVVMANVNRTIASPWGFWPDQTDSLSQRDTGWIQYYSESAQESLDTVIQAYWVAEKVRLPAMVIHEAFYVSHALEVVEVPSQELVDAYLPAYRPPHSLNPDKVESWGNVVTQEMYNRHRFNLGQAMDDSLQVASEADALWREFTGRYYGLVEEHYCEGAEIVVVAMGSLAGNVRLAVEELRKGALPIGFLKIKLFRPFPLRQVREILAGIPRVIVLDRNFAPGTGGILYQELKAAIFGVNNNTKVFGYLAGVGGTNVSPHHIISLVNEAMGSEPINISEWR